MNRLYLGHAKITQVKCPWGIAASDARDRVDLNKNIPDWIKNGDGVGVFSGFLGGEDKFSGRE